MAPLALANGQALLLTPTSAPDPFQTPTTQVLLQPTATRQGQSNNEGRNIFHGRFEYKSHSRVAQCDELNPCLSCEYSRVEPIEKTIGHQLNSSRLKYLYASQNERPSGKTYSDKLKRTADKVRYVIIMSSAPSSESESFLFPIDLMVDAHLRVLWPPGCFIAEVISGQR